MIIIIIIIGRRRSSPPIRRVLLLLLRRREDTDARYEAAPRLSGDGIEDFGVEFGGCEGWGGVEVVVVVGVVLEVVVEVGIVGKGCGVKATVLGLGLVLVLVSGAGDGCLRSGAMGLELRLGRFGESALGAVGGCLEAVVFVEDAVEEDV